MSEFKSIMRLKAELEVKLEEMFEEFQRRSECRGVQIQHVQVNQVDWHNGAGSTPEINLRSDSDIGYRVQSVELTLVLK
jgi:hypothetical protein